MRPSAAFDTHGWCFDRPTAQPWAARALTASLGGRGLLVPVDRYEAKYGSGFVEHARRRDPAAGERPSSHRSMPSDAPASQREQASLGSPVAGRARRRSGCRRHGEVEPLLDSIPPSVLPQPTIRRPIATDERGGHPDMPHRVRGGASAGTTAPVRVGLGRPAGPSGREKHPPLPSQRERVPAAVVTHEQSQFVPSLRAFKPAASAAR